MFTGISWYLPVSIFSGSISHLNCDKIDLCPRLLTLYTEGSALYSTLNKQYVVNFDTDTTSFVHLSIMHVDVPFQNLNEWCLPG